MNEADHKSKLVAEINALRGGYARRWEDRWRVGQLDLVLKLPDPLPMVWAEGKMIIGNLFRPTERQWVEGNKILASGMIAILIGWKGKEMSISPWAWEADFRRCFTGADRVETLMEYLSEPRRQSA